MQAPFFSCTMFPSLCALWIRPFQLSLKFTLTLNGSCLSHEETHLKNNFRNAGYALASSRWQSHRAMGVLGSYPVSPRSVLHAPTHQPGSRQFKLCSRKWQLSMCRYHWDNWRRAETTNNLSSGSPIHGCQGTRKQLKGPWTEITKSEERIFDFLLNERKRAEWFKMPRRPWGSLTPLPIAP